MVCARPPFRANNHVELAKTIEDRKDEIRFTEGVVTSRAMKDLIRGLLKRIPVERMSYERFFSDPVIRDEIPGLVDEDLPQPLEPVSIDKSKRAQKLPAESDRRMQEGGYSQSPKDKTSYGATPPSGPSRPTPAQHASGTPPRPSSIRRTSNTPLATVEQQPLARVPRPVLPNSSTAPVRPVTLQDRDPAPTAAGHGRRYSRDDIPSPIPGLKEHLDRERTPQRDTGTLKEVADRAIQDAAIDEGFVFVEKRRVEIDALADEIAASPQTGRERAIVPKRRATTQGTPTSTTGATVPSNAIQIAQPKQGATHQRTGSYERRRQYRPSFESATSALSKAMNMVNIRGLGLSPPMTKGVSPPQGYAAFPTYPAAQSSLLLVGESTKHFPKDEESSTIKTVEGLAQLSDVVYWFAEVKYKQLVPAAPSEQGLGIGPDGISRMPAADDDDSDDDLTSDAVVIISEEALVLFVKSLALLNKAMDIAGSWWNRRHRSSSAPDSSPRGMSYTDRLNRVVSFVRDRFNECCTKTEIVARKLKQAQQQLPPDHPSHPSNAAAASGSATTIGSTENILLTTGVTAEKLMYDRALEMSRSAAVSELVGDDPDGCERNYWTAIRMLEAILEDDEEPSSKRSASDEVNGLESEDRKTVQTLLQSMKNRHRSLKKKLEAQKSAKSAKRASITSAPASASTGRSPPALQKGSH